MLSQEAFVEIRKIISDSVRQLKDRIDMAVAEFDAEPALMKIAHANIAEVIVDHIKLTPEQLVMMDICGYPYRSLPLLVTARLEKEQRKELKPTPFNVESKALETDPTISFKFEISPSGPLFNSIKDGKEHVKWLEENFKAATEGVLLEDLSYISFSPGYKPSDDEIQLLEEHFNLLGWDFQTEVLPQAGFVITLR